MKLLTKSLKYLSLAGIVLGFMLAGGTAKAAPVSCGSLAPADVNPGGDTTSIVCAIGILTFSNFQYANEGGDPSPSITLLNPQPSPCVPAAAYCLGLNPNLIGTGVQDLHLIFEVTSTVPITSVTLADTGGTAPDGISEHVCDANGVSLSLGTCTDSTPLLASLAVNNDTTATVTLTVASTTIWIWKDINVGNTGHLSAFDEGFNAAASGVPEPMTLSMMGVGLLGLGLLGRRLRK